MNNTEVLIVDDNVRLRRYVKEILHTETDIKIIGEAGDGLEAINLAKKLKPDLILMDIRMPKLHGIEAIRQIKQDNPEIKIIILTLHDLEEYRQAALNVGANDFLAKNRMTDDLVPVIRNTLENKKTNIR